ncbi:MAG: hypothetical protein AABX66_01725 [Nanoarchaeota archaeon]|mgnify:CR=1 FL=1
MPLTIKKIKNARMPNLDTLIMIEKFVSKNSGKFNQRQLWLNLPKKMMWQTFLVALDYLEKTGRINLELSKLVCPKILMEKTEIPQLINSIPSYVY